MAPADEKLRNDAYRDMKNAYRLRSKIVHGDEKNIKNVEATWVLLSRHMRRLLEVLLTSRNNLMHMKPEESLLKIVLE